MTPIESVTLIFKFGEQAKNSLDVTCSALETTVHSLADATIKYRFDVVLVGENKSGGNN